MTTRFVELLSILYDAPVAEATGRAIEDRLKRASVPSKRPEAWHASDVIFITYADAIQAEGESPLRTLHRFLQQRLSGLIAQVHLLPFFPYTSDDGFAVSDYRELAAGLGTWEDIRALSEDHELMFDLVINHASSAHPLFQDFLSDRPPGNRYFLTASADQDVSGVTRPRASPLLQTFETAKGPQQVWCTFSRDQVDWDFTNPDVLLEFVDLFVGYMERGATWVRMDAIAYLWKELGTDCVHRPQTHAVVKLFRLIAHTLSSDIKILTETNVPLPENLRYFGNGDEAHIIYNFSLPPILVHALVTGSGACLTDWCRSLPAAPEGCTYLNFTASHDGIGIRPAEGILTEPQIRELTDCIQDFGGRINQRQRPDGTLGPYEANIALFDALKGTVAGEDGWQVERFLLSQGLMMALAGVPAIYYNSVLAAPNNLEGMAETGRNRTINRRKWTQGEVADRLAEADGTPHRVLSGLQQMLGARIQISAFHPEAPQQCVIADDRVFVLLRTCPTSAQQILCLFNLTKEPVELDKSALRLDADVAITERYVRGDVNNTQRTVSLSPYAMGWLELD